MTNHANKTFHASLLVAVSGILYGFLGYLGMGALRENISISTMLFWRFLIAGAFVAFFLLKRSPTESLRHPDKKHALLFMFFIGAIGYAGSSGFYFAASQYTGTGLAMVIFFSYPILVALLSFALQQHKLNRITIGTLLAMMIGLFLLRDSSVQQINILGIFFGIIAAACYAFYVVGSKHISADTINPNILTIMVCFSCAFIFLLWSIASHSFVLPQSIKSWSYLFALGIFATALPIQLMLLGLQQISSMRASMISVLEPLVTVIVGVILLNESISSQQFLGGVIILGSALFVQFQKEL